MGEWTIRRIVARHRQCLVVNLSEWAAQFKFLIRNGDSKFTAAFDEVLSGNGTLAIKTPVQWTPLQHHGYQGPVRAQQIYEGLIASTAGRPSRRKTALQRLWTSFGAARDANCSGMLN
jgi:hypothetical protein